MRLILIRHPRPDVPSEMCYGRLDVPVETQALADTVAALRPRLPPEACIYTSPAQRARLLAEQLTPAPRIHPGLHELDFGHWEGCNWSALPRADIDAWAAQPIDYAPGGGESVRAAVTRVHRTLDELLGGNFIRQNPPAHAMVWVTHAGVIRIMDAWLQCFDETHCAAQAVMARLDIPYGAWREWDLSFMQK